MRIRVEPAELDQVRRDISGTLDRLQSIQSHLKHQMRGLDYEGGRRSGLDHRWERIDRQFRELSEQYRELGAFVEAKKRAYLEADNHGQRAQGGGKGAGFIRSAVSMGLDFLPVVGNVKGIVEAVTGRDPVTGQKLTAAERALGVLGPFGKGVKQGAKLLKLADETAEAVVQGVKQADKADEAGDAARAGGGITQEKVSMNSPGVGGELLRRSIEFRQELPKEIQKTGNFGLAEVKIEGLRTEFKSHSRVNELKDAGNAEGYSVLKPDPKDWNFTPQEVNTKDIINGEGAYSRKWDTEFKIIEDITDQLKALKPEQRKGSIDIYTDREPCASCGPILEQFKARFPDIQVNVYFAKNLKR
ncbi:Rhs core protein [Paenibacillus mucilaginosus 3016]|uniref:Rhs core protein n=1 Tax=Paenibacillus mucilaginosus 3016 TaxID=1116391 RepID=H6NNJ5_9BACL|nr:deaminase domain-containing protein [Paenibacillus mucilaginosus]AFC33316.1 Rhs core protein [Paenibacillus mucilaginosus 3016]WFA21734.1 hypothetical protein ERY13_33315 [Paenibacillus mucilaginosus]